MLKAVDGFYRFLDEPIFPWARVVLALLTIFVGLELHGADVAHQHARRLNTRKGSTSTSIRTRWMAATTATT